ncbi:MAG: cytochrome C [Hyphomonadaceae bacterium]
MMMKLDRYLIAGALLMGAACSAPEAQPDPQPDQAANAVRSEIAVPASADSAADYDLGSATVGSLCVSCHSNRQIENTSGYTRAQWQSLIGAMVDLSATPDVEAATLDYLAATYPPSANRQSTLVDGPLEVGFEAWVVPTLGQGSRDPVEGPDGRYWWVGQLGNILGWINPETGEMKEYPLPEGARPHSVNLDANGTAWYMGNGNGTIGKLDEATGEFTVYEMPDPDARDPHTGEFDENGILWFTLQRSNMIGRFDPASGDIDLVTLPTERSRPYGIKIDKDGSLWVACNGSNCLIHVDPETMALEEIKLPIPETTVRRLDIDEDGVIWYVNSSQGRLGRYDPASGDIREWPSPSGPASHPYALAVVDGIVWYNESGVRPDPLVRFDPKTETFQSWPVPSGDIYAGIIRHMRATRNGELLIHQGSTNRILRASLPAAD